MQISVTIKGESPLLQAKFPIESRTQSQLAGRKKIGAEGLNNPEDLIYKNSEGYYCPYTYIEGCLRKAAVNFKVGKKSYRNIVATLVSVEPSEIPMRTSGWQAFAHVVNNRRVGRLVVVSPRFNDWELTFTLEILEDKAISPETLRAILEHGGKYEGIGAWRPNLDGKFGKFAIVSFEELK